MAALLVSVRNAEEARAALNGGAAVIDVKEPDRGPLGRADSSAWRAVLDEVSKARPVSVALGELKDVGGFALDAPGLAFRKLGLAQAPPDWASRWRRLMEESGPTPWVAVIYADFEAAAAPPPKAILNVALDSTPCRGVLIDTYRKDRASPLDPSWRPIVERIQAEGRFVALAGGLDRDGIKRLTTLRPDLFAVRGSACANGNRTGSVDARRVSELVEAAQAVPGPLHPALASL